MADFQRDVSRAFIACVFIVPVLLYSLITVSYMFDMDVPLWLVWVATLVPPAIAVLVLIVRILERAHPRFMPQGHRR